jgi:DNA-binding IscR family transcriptional regulator
MATSRSRAFCRALAEETRARPQRRVSITAVADRLGLEQQAAEALAAELDDAGLVRVGGGYSATLEEAGLLTYKAWPPKVRYPVRHDPKPHRPRDCAP